MRAHLAKLFAVALFALPVLGVYLPGLQPNAENRALAPIPPLPATVGQSLLWPAAMEAGINDRFPLRPTLVRSNTRLRHALFGQFPTIQVAAGRDGYMFLANHTVQGAPYGAIRIACGDGYDGVDRIVQEINYFEKFFARRGLKPKLLIVPSGPLVYNRHLPAWMAARCPDHAAPALAILASSWLQPAARALTYFPLDVMRALGPDTPPQPQHYFHWAGDGPRAVAEAAEQRFWGRAASVASPLATAYAPGPSDYQSLYPGIEIIRTVGTPVLAGSSITACEGPACLPELAGAATKLHMVARYRNSAPGLGPRLVILSDSFGPSALPWFARFHEEVVLIGTNNIPLLDAAEKARLRAFVFRPDSKDELLYLYHDATVYSSRVLGDMQFFAP